jgi:hypothetical protein
MKTKYGGKMMKININYVLLCMIIVILIAFTIFNDNYHKENTENLREFYSNIVQLQQERITNAELDAQKCYIDKSYYEKNLNDTKSELQSKSQCVIKEVKKINIHELDIIAEQVANAKEYILDVYDCTEFSRDLAKAFNDAGYNARQVLVTVDCDSPTWNTSEYCFNWKNNHAITEVTIYYEATRGWHIPAYQYKDYRIKK